MVGLNNNNGDDVKINDSTVIFPDVLASNGVIQIIDQVLVPSNIDITAFLHTCGGSSGSDIGRSSSSSDDPPSLLLYDIPITAINGGIFTTLVAMLSVTDLVSTLSEPNGPYTVFAPTDDAFAALPEGVLVCLLEEHNLPLLSNILLYHVAPGQTLVSTDLFNGMNIPTLFERQNVMITILNNKYGDGDVDVKIDDATVLFPDVRASNGMIHIIDQVLIPPSIDIPAFLASSCGNNHNNEYEYSSSSSSSSSLLVVPEPIVSTDPYRQQSTGTTTSYRQQQPPTMYPTGPDPYQNQHQHEISYYDSSTTITTSKTNDPYRQQQSTTGSTTTPYRQQHQPPTMYPTGTDPYKQEIYYDSSNYYDYSTTTIMNRYHYYAPLSRRVLPPPTLHPTPVPPTHYPTCSPTLPPTPQPTPNPTPDPTPRPTSFPTLYPTPLPTFYPTPLPTPYPTPFPTQYPTPYYPNKPIIYPEPYYSPIYPVYQEPKPYNPPPPKTYPVVYQDPVDENFYQEQPNNDPYYHEDPHPPYYPEPDPAHYDSRQQHNDDPSVGPYVRTHNNPN